MWPGVSHEFILCCSSFLPPASYSHSSSSSLPFLLLCSSSRLMETAREMIRESLPIKCLEAVILGMYPLHTHTHARTHTRTHTRTHADTHMRTHTRTHVDTHGKHWAKRLFCYLCVKSVRRVALTSLSPITTTTTLLLNRVAWQQALLKV